MLDICAERYRNLHFIQKVKKKMGLGTFLTTSDILCMQ